MASNLGIKIEDKGKVKLILIEGYFDAVMVNEINEKIYDILESDCDSIIFDLAKLDYISSAGLRVLLYTAKKMKVKGGKVALCTVGKSIQKVLKISGLDSIFSTYETQDEALKTF